MGDDGRVLQLATAAGSAEDAAAIADALVRRRLAACAQVVGPVASRYWWQGRVEEATEWLCVAKTTAGRLDEAVAAVRDLHRYELPEIVATPVVGGHGPYLAWVAGETSAPPG